MPGEGKEVGDDVLGLDPAGSDDEIGDRLATHIEGLVASLGLPTRLSLVGVPEKGIPILVEGAMGDGCTLMNPRDPSEDDYAELFRAAL